MNIKWTENEKNFVRENANVMKDVDIAKALTEQTGRNVSLHAVRKVRQSFGMKKKQGRGVCKLLSTE